MSNCTNRTPAISRNLQSFPNSVRLQPQGGGGLALALLFPCLAAMFVLASEMSTQVIGITMAGLGVVVMLAVPTPAAARPACTGASGTSGCRPSPS